MLSGGNYSIYIANCTLVFSLRSLLSLMWTTRVLTLAGVDGNSTASDGDFLSSSFTVQRAHPPRRDLLDMSELPGGHCYWLSCAHTENFPTAKIRALLQLVGHLKDICYDSLSGSRTQTSNDNLDIEQISDQLTELRDVLEQLFKVAIAGVHPSGSTPLADQINDLLAKSKSDITDMEIALKQESGRKRIKRSSPSPDFQLTLTDLVANTIALRNIVDTNQQ